MKNKGGRGCLAAASGILLARAPFDVGPPACLLPHFCDAARRMPDACVRRSGPRLGRLAPPPPPLRSAPHARAARQYGVGGRGECAMTGAPCEPCEPCAPERVHFSSPFVHCAPPALAPAASCRALECPAAMSAGRAGRTDALLRRRGVHCAPLGRGRQAGG